VEYETCFDWLVPEMETILYHMYMNIMLGGLDKETPKITYYMVRDVNGS
jgi:hypothetical protein